MFDLISVIIIAVFVFLGLRSGLVKAALKLIGLALAVFAASQYYALGGKLIASLLDVAEGVRTVVGFVLVFIVVFLFFELISSMIKSLLRAMKLIWIDRLGGVLFGFIEGVVVMMVMVWIINVYPELGFVNRLQKTSNTFNLLSRLEHKVVEVAQLEDRLEGLRKNLRRSVFLPEDPSPETDTIDIVPPLSLP